MWFAKGIDEALIICSMLLVIPAKLHDCFFEYESQCYYIHQVN